MSHDVVSEITIKRPIDVVAAYMPPPRTTPRDGTSSPKPVERKTEPPLAVASPARRMTLRNRGNPAGPRRDHSVVCRA